MQEMGALQNLFSRIPSLRRSDIAYHVLPSNDREHNETHQESHITSGWLNGAGLKQRRHWALLIRKKQFLFSVIFFIVIIGGSIKARHHYRREPHQEPPRYHWESYPKLNGYYNGVRTLVNYTDWVPEHRVPRDAKIKIHDAPPLDPQVVNPYPNFTSDEYLKNHHPVQICYLDEEGRYPPPDIYAYPGIPAKMTAPYWGTYETLEVAPNRCYERFGRFGPYGYSYGPDEGGLGLSEHSAHVGAEKVQSMMNKTDYRHINWSKAQKQCFEKNKQRFESNDTVSGGNVDGKKKRVTRTAFVLRTWIGYDYSKIQLLTLRAMITELSLKSGGEYDVHLLVHVKDDNIPIWASQEVYNQTIKDNVPEEFWDMATLWSEQLMRTYYPGPFPNEDNFENLSEGPVHGVYRGAHFPLQWFAQEHQEYDFIWNWEMDIRYTGHYYEFLNGVSNWAAKQPRKLMWERNQRFWIPELHGNWSTFSNLVGKETAESGEPPVWGPLKFPMGKYEMLSSPNSTRPPTTLEEDHYQWGVGEDADFITFDPLFDASKSNWIFRNDVTGYDTSVDAPPRRVAIVTVSRLSRRLLNTMHEETWRMHRTMFPEMWPPSVALHHGYKALFAPHPVYFDRQWPLDVMDKTFNRPLTPEDSPFAKAGEHNLQGGSFYYNAEFSGVLWRRWLGAKEEGEGGAESERKHTDRMCLRPILHHPIKHEAVE